LIPCGPRYVRVWRPSTRACRTMRRSACGSKARTGHPMGADRPAIRRNHQIRHGAAHRRRRARSHAAPLHPLRGFPSGHIQRPTHVILFPCFFACVFFFGQKTAYSSNQYLQHCLETAPPLRPSSSEVCYNTSPGRNPICYLSGIWLARTFPRLRPRPAGRNNPRWKESPL